MRCLSFSFILVLILAASCAPTVASTPQTLPAATPTPLPAPSPTPLPEITAEAWARDSLTGKIDPAKMFPVVGAINHKHHFTLDLSFGMMRLAVVIDDDLTKIVDQNALRERIGITLNQNEELRHRLIVIRGNLIKEFNIRKDFSDFVIVIERDMPSQIVRDSNGGLIRYSTDENSNLSRLSVDDYPLLPKLSILGKDITRADTGEIIRLKGFVMVNPMHDMDQISLKETFNYMEDAKSKGANIARFHMSTALYNKTTVTAITEKAQELGMYVMFTPSGTKRGEYQNIPLPDETVENTVLQMAADLKPYNNVIYDVWSEPNFNPEINISKKQAWSTYLDRTESIISRLREIGINNIIAVSGFGWGREFDNLRLLDLNKKYINILYRVNDNPGNWGSSSYLESDYRDRWDELLDGKHAVVIGEFLPVDPPDDTYGYRMSTEERIRWENETMALVHQFGFSYTQSAYTPQGYKDWTIIARLEYLPNGSIHYIFNDVGNAIDTNLQSQPGYQFDK